MKVLIIEDEKLAAERLINIIHELEPYTEIAGKIESVRSAVKWLNENQHPDLIFMDVQLADGICFEIFEKVNIDCPVIFTTAYNEYALKAFKVNSIDYLLKPIDSKELNNSLLKYKKLNNPAVPSLFTNPEIIQKVTDMIRNPYRLRYVIRIGEHIKAIDVQDISFFFSSDKSTFIRTSSGRDYGIDASLEQIEKEIDPKTFFRVCRKQIIAIAYISDIIAYSGSRLKINMKGGENDDIIVSREKVGDFKRWLEGK